MSRGGKTQLVSEYLLRRIKGRMQSLGISNKDLADEVGQSESNISRMLRQDVRRIVYLDRLRDVLALPEDELESQYQDNAAHIQTLMAKVMAADATLAELFIEDVEHLSRFFAKLSRLRSQIAVTEAMARGSRTPEEKATALDGFKKLKAEEAKLARARKELTRILS